MDGEIYKIVQYRIEEVRMNIVQICYLYEPAIGGVENYVKNLSELLVCAGHKVTVLCSNWLDLKGRTSTDKYYENIDGVNVFRAKAKRKIKYKWHAQNFGFSISKFEQIIIEADVLHVHSFPSDHFFEAIKIANKFNKPVVVHGHYNPEHIALYKSVIRKYYWRYIVIPALKNACKYISIVDLEKQAFIQNWGVSSVFFADIPNAINTQELSELKYTKSELCSKFKLPSSAKIALAVSRITPSKGIEKILKIAKLSRDNPDFFFLVIGKIEDEIYYERIQNEITTECLENIRLFEVDRPWVVSAFQHCDFFLFPSQGEVFGIVLAEAMFCSKLCLASPYGGITDVVKHQQTGIIVDNNAPALYYEYLVHFNKSENERRILEQSAHLTARTRFDWNNVFREVEKLYGQCVTLKPFTIKRD